MSNELSNGFTVSKTLIDLLNRNPDEENYSGSKRLFTDLKKQVLSLISALANLPEKEYPETEIVHELFTMLSQALSHNSEATAQLISYLQEEIRKLNQQLVQEQKAKSDVETVLAELEEESVEKKEIAELQEAKLEELDSKPKGYSYFRFGKSCARQKFLLLPETSFDVAVKILGLMDLFDHQATEDKIPTDKDLSKHLNIEIILSLIKKCNGDETKLNKLKDIIKNLVKNIYLDERTRLLKEIDLIFSSLR